MPVLRAAFAGASVVWVLLLPLVPFLATRPHASGLGTVLVVAIYSIGHLICHQLPERSFHLWGAQLPVCARCTGIYAGAALAVLFAAGSATAPRTRRVVMDAALVRRLFIVAALPTAATLLYEWTTGDTPSHLVRAAAGVPIGAAVAWLVVAATRPGAPAENRVN